MRRGLPHLGLAAIAAASLTALAGCGLTADDPDLVAGKQLFVERCGACHILERAGTQGTTGPNLDAAFERALRDGFNRDGIEGAVHEQILYPARLPEGHPAYMPPKLVEGDAAWDVAAYVAYAVSREGEDEGVLAQAVPEAGGGEPAVAENGTVTIPADPNGQLAYVSEQAIAPPGELVIDSPNESQVPHNIAIQEQGIDAVGEVVQNGGVSTIDVDVEPGEYTYFCTVEGHREAGMEGTLTVEE